MNISNFVYCHLLILALAYPYAFGKTEEVKESPQPITELASVQKDIQNKNLEDLKSKEEERLRLEAVRKKEAKRKAIQLKKEREEIAQANEREKKRRHLLESMDRYERTFYRR